MLYGISEAHRARNISLASKLFCTFVDSHLFSIPSNSPLLCCVLSAFGGASRWLRHRASGLRRTYNPVRPWMFAASRASMPVAEQSHHS